MTDPRYPHEARPRPPYPPGVSQQAPYPPAPPRQPPFQAPPRQAPPHHRDPHFPVDDLRATLETRRELGPEYDAALTESFVARIQDAVSAQVRAEADRRLPNAKQAEAKERQESSRALGLALGSLGIAIPLTGVAAAASGLPGLIVAWSGVVLVNFAYALGRMGGRRRG